MARSKDARKYIIVTKTPRYTFWYTDIGSVVEPNDERFEEERDKTFWLINKEDEETVGRFSVKSAPKWVMAIYNQLVDNGT